MCHPPPVRTSATDTAAAATAALAPATAPTTASASAPAHAVISFALLNCLPYSPSDLLARARVPETEVHGIYCLWRTNNYVYV